MAVPKKGRLYDQCIGLLERAGIKVQYENYDAEMNTSDVKKIKNHRKQNLEDETNNMQLDKEDTQ